MCNRPAHIHRHSLPPQLSPHYAEWPASSNRAIHSFMCWSTTPGELTASTNGEKINRVTGERICQTSLEKLLLLRAQAAELARRLRFCSLRWRGKSVWGGLIGCAMGLG